MRGPVYAGDRTLLVVAGALLVLLSLAALLLGPSPDGAARGFPSSYSTTSRGAKAAYILLEKLGYKVERWSSRPHKLPSEAQDVVLVLADPLIPASGEETTELQWFLRRGGRILITGEAAESLLRLPGIVSPPKADTDWKEFPSRLPGPVSRLAPWISMKSRLRWKSGPSEGLAYYGDGEGGTVVSLPFASGKVIWWADSSPLTNYGLAQSSNLFLFLNSVGEAKSRRVFWDEYYHGQRPGLWSYVARTPLPWLLLQTVFLILAVVLTHSRRSGPVMAAPRESRLSPLEFVETVGDLYARRRAAAGALEIAYHRFRSLLARRLGLSAGLALEVVRRAIREHTFGMEPELTLVLSQCEAAVQAGNNDEHQALKLVQELRHHTRRLRLAGKGD